MKSLKSLSLITLTVLIVSAAGAAPVYYYNDSVADRAAFQGAAPGTLVLESFEAGFTPTTSLSFNSGQPEEFTVTVDTDTFQHSNFMRGVTDGSYALAFNEDYPSLTVTFSFVTPIKAFGLDINDMNFDTVSYLDNLGNTVTDVLAGDQGSDDGGPGYQNIQFFGVINTESFNTIQFNFVNDSSDTGTLFMDYLQFSIPEPCTLLLMAFGAAACRFTRRRN